MRLYIAVTNDEYELIIAFSETKKGLAQQLGIDPTCVGRALRRPGGNGSKSNRIIKEVEINDEEE